MHKLKPEEHKHTQAYKNLPFCLDLKNIIYSTVGYIVQVFFLYHLQFRWIEKQRRSKEDQQETEMNTHCVKVERQNASSVRDKAVIVFNYLEPKQVASKGESCDDVNAVKLTKTLKRKLLKKRHES